MRWREKTIREPHLKRKVRFLFTFCDQGERERRKMGGRGGHGKKGHAAGMRSGRGERRTKCECVRVCRRVLCVYTCV